jgi:hypothetical protein
MARRTKVEQLLVELALETNNFKKGLKLSEKEAKKSGGRMEKAFKGASGGANKLGSAIVAGIVNPATLAGAGVGVLAAQLSSMTREALAGADNIGKMSDALGLSTDAFQELEFVSSQSGLSLEEFQMNIRNLNKRLGEAKAKASEASKVFEDLGLDPQQLNTSEQALNAIADRFADIEDPVEKSRLALKLFEEGGIRFINVLNRGASGINELRAEARALGIVLEEDLIRQSEALNDELDKSQRRIDVQMKGALISLGPVLVQTSGFFADLAGDVGKFFSSLKEVDELTFRETKQRLSDTINQIGRLRTELDEVGGTLGGEGSGRATFLREELKKQEAALVLLQKRRRALSELQDQEKEAEEERQKRVASAAAEAARLAREEKAASGVRDLETEVENQRRLNEVLDESVEIRNRVKDSIGAEAAAAKLGEEASEAQRKRVRELFTELQSLRREETERTARMKKINDLVKRGGSASQKLSRETKLLNDAYREGKVTLDEYKQGIKGVQDEFEKATKKTDEAADATKEALERIADSVDQFQQDVERAFVDLVFEADNFREGFANALKALSKQLFAEALIRPITSQLSNLFRNELGVGSNNNTQQTLVSGLLSGLGGLFRAEGGPVAAGKPAIVGERGPELLLPKTNGSVVSNAAMASLLTTGRGAAPVVNMPIQVVNAPGIQTSTQRVPDPSGAILTIITNEFVEDMGRGGPMNRAMRASFSNLKQNLPR